MKNEIHSKLANVLILIVVEDTLRARINKIVATVCIGLNPYCNGRCSQRQKYITSDNERITDLYYNLFTKFY